MRLGRGRQPSRAAAAGVLRAPGAAAAAATSRAGTSSCCRTTSSPCHCPESGRELVRAILCMCGCAPLVGDDG